MRKKVNKSISFEDFDEFMAALKKRNNEDNEEFNFSGNIASDGSKNFTINWTSEEEV
ncbi:hypothetical protein KAU51_04255 [Candidatus Parcubacteria bacterium]|nr:hypothetical protein [Candidatus Parcubacteria bacterium]